MSKEEFDIILLIRDFPLITSYQIQRLTGRHFKAIERSLLKLARTGYIQRNKRENINRPYVYALTRRAIKVKEIGGYYIDLSDRKDLTLRHEEFINDVHIELRPYTWQQREKEICKYGIQPDAFFQLKSGERTRSFFLEAERHTNNARFFRKKIEGYIALRNTKAYEYFGINQFTVLTVGVDEAHTRELAEITAHLIDPKHRKLYLFSPLPVQTCIVPHDIDRYPLMPA